MCRALGFYLFFTSYNAATHLKTSDGTYQQLSELPHFCSKNRHFVCAVAARAKFFPFTFGSPRKSSPFTVLVFHRTLIV